MDLDAIRMRVRMAGAVQAGEVPTDTLPLRTERPGLLPSTRQKIIEQAFGLCGKKTGPISAWVLRRENEYAVGPGAGWEQENMVCYAACMDLLGWLRSKKPYNEPEDKTAAWGRKNDLDATLAAKPLNAPYQAELL